MFYFLASILIDWRATVHWNVLLTVYQKCWHPYYSWKIVKPCWQSIVLPITSQIPYNSTWKFYKARISESNIPLLLLKLKLKYMCITWFSMIKLGYSDFFSSPITYSKSDAEIDKNSIHKISLHCIKLHKQNYSCNFAGTNWNKSGSNGIFWF